jgi:hypothetical protein
MIILSCGCQSGDFGIEAEWDTFSREGKPAIECGFICQKHFELYDARTSEPDVLKEKRRIHDLANLVSTRLKEKNT